MHVRVPVVESLRVQEECEPVGLSYFGAFLDPPAEAGFPPGTEELGAEGVSVQGGVEAELRLDQRAQPDVRPEEGEEGRRVGSRGSQGKKTFTVCDLSCCF